MWSFMFSSRTYSVGSNNRSAGGFADNLETLVSSSGANT